MSGGAAALCSAAPALAALLIAIGVPSGASAHIPSASRVVQAVAQQNRASGRTRSLQFDLELRVGNDETVGRGTLVSHPTGLARLELRASNGLVERHLLQGTEYRSSRNGVPLVGPRRFLPPLFLLQTESSLGLRAGLAELGADLDSVGLAPCGESDCYVLGDPSRVPPSRTEEPDVASGFDDGSRQEGSFSSFSPSVIEGPYATIWVDTETFEVKRMDMRNGVRVWLGPRTSFGRVQAPSWMRIDEPGKQPIRFEIENVSAVDAPAAAFTEAWLDGPEGSPGQFGAPPDGDFQGGPQSRPGGNP